MLCRDSSPHKSLSIAYFTYSYKGIFLVDMDVDKIEIFTLRGCVTEKHTKTRRSLGLRSQVNMGTEGQGYGEWTNTHDNGAIAPAFFPKHVSIKNSALRRKMTEL